METCRIEGCPDAIQYRRARLCVRHYTRMRRHGDPTATVNGEGTSTCLQCFTPLGHRRVTAKFCDERCKTRWRRRVADEPVECAVCGTRRIARSDAIYCSRRCTARAANLRLLYGLQPADWHRLLIEQAGRCGICTHPLREAHVDHDHETGIVRGLLCSACNTGIGLLAHDPVRLLAAVDYLRSSPALL